MSWHTPERKVEQAIKTYLQTVLEYEILGVQITTRFSNLEKTEPRIEIFCSECSPWPEIGESDTGNWECQVTISVISHYALNADAETHDELCGNVMDQLFLTDSGADAGAAEIMKTQTDADIEIFDMIRGVRRNDVDGHSIRTEQDLTVRMAVAKL